VISLGGDSSSISAFANLMDISDLI
jgi:hypothetical protein